MEVYLAKIYTASSNNRIAFILTYIAAGYRLRNDHGQRHL